MTGYPSSKKSGENWKRLAILKVWKSQENWREFLND